MSWPKLKHKWHLRPFLITVIVVMCLVILHYLGIIIPIESLIGRAFQPVQRGFFVAYNKISYGLSSFSNLADIEEENRLLRAERTRLSGQITKLISIAQDNTILREQLRLQKSRERELVFAKLLGYHDREHDHKILINIGSADKISRDMPVILYDSLIGVIDDVSIYSSSVNLISNSKLVINAYVQGKPDAKGIVHGQEGSSALLFSHLDKSIKLDMGEFVLTTGQGIRDNRNILIGTIIEKLESAKDPYNSYLVSPALELKKLDTVFVVTSSS